MYISGARYAPCNGFNNALRYAPRCLCAYIITQISTFFIERLYSLMRKHVCRTFMLADANARL